MRLIILLWAIGMGPSAKAAHLCDEVFAIRLPHASDVRTIENRIIKNRAIAQKQAFEAIWQNIQNPEVTPGAIIASPSKKNPDYFYHWVRDASITMLTLHDQTPKMREQFIQFLEFTRINQTKVLDRLGEPKFYVNGDVYKGVWGRPQNDGPALRALAFIRFLQDLNPAQDSTLIQSLYHPTASSVIKTDLEFVSHHWRDASYDVWEEVAGDHFFTRMVQRKALILGGDLAEKMGDTSAAAWYRKQAHEVELSLEAFYNPQKKFIVATLNRAAGIETKASGIDSAVILGVLLGDLPGRSFSVTDPRVIETVKVHEGAFKPLYPINQKFKGTAMGRYPEDTYDGVGTSSGNPWFLTTLGYAEWSYRVAQTFPERSVELMAWLSTGDDFLTRIDFHSANSMSEQFDRETGYMRGAPDLTWSYSALLSALKERSKLVH